jgi:hypothetical protein
MIKLVHPNFEDGNEPLVQLVKLSSRGLRNEDRSWLVKRAASDLLHSIDSVQLKPGEQLIHLIAMGSTEGFGHNRNGDGFKAASLRKYHDTFVKHAHLYRDHLNKNPAKSYGRVVASTFHEPMQRVELLVALNGNEKAAQANKGLVADRELEKLSSGQPLAVSMACTVPFDKCSYCENEAKTRADYCRGVTDGGHCKAGGLMHKIGSLVEIDGKLHQLHADNPDPMFFDISHVYRPADRTAYVSGLLKSAGAVPVLSGAFEAEIAGVTAPLDVLLATKRASVSTAILKQAYRLAEFEDAVASGTLPVGYVDSFENSTNQPPPIPKQASAQLNTFLGALSAAHVILPVTSFVELVTGLPQEKAAAVAIAVRKALPGVYSRLIADNEQLSGTASYAPVSCTNSEYMKWAMAVADSCGMTKQAATRRLRLAAVRNELRDHTNLDLMKTASVLQSAPATQLAMHYALYKLAFLGAFTEFENEALLTDQLIVLQNYAN